ncbi:hypothetical protein [Streptomyces sp. NPDC059538]|uniref:hypothetical protein n=1 Tax=Streptomyces sp. NPDC059538 TaxID=3346860 RepID=UPI003693B15E
MTSQTMSTAAAGTWHLGDLTINRMGFGTMRLPQTGAAFADDAVPRDRDQAIGVLRRAIELGVNHLDTAAHWWRGGIRYLQYSWLRALKTLGPAAMGPRWARYRAEPPPVVGDAVWAWRRWAGR